MRIYKNDIVEIITHKYKNYRDIPESEQYSWNMMIDVDNKIHAFIGQRFRVSEVNDSHVYSKGYHGYRIPIEHVIIYKSPLVNRIKRFFKF